jgi:hypothetical protein
MIEYVKLRMQHLQKSKFLAKLPISIFIGINLTFQRNPILFSAHTNQDSSVKSKKTAILCKVVQDELNSNGYLKPNQVVVVLDGGSLHLTGKVRTYFHRQMAIAVAKKIGIEIRDEILVQKSSALQS